MKGIVLGLILFLVVPGLCLTQNNVEKANPRDVAIATEYLMGLPPRCGDSYTWVSPDGTVNIQLLCERGKISGPEKKLFTIKNGVWKEL